MTEPSVHALPTRSRVGAHADPTSAQLVGMGPICLLLCRLVVLLSPIMLLGGFLSGPVTFPRVLFLMPALGAVLLAPREAVLRIQVSLPLAMLIIWMAMSTMWSIDRGETLLALRQQIGPLLALILVAGLLPVEETVTWWVRGIKLMLVMMIFAVIDTRSDPPVIVDGEVIEGWYGWYFSKNEFGRGAVVAVLSLLVLDEKTWSRAVFLGLALVFVVGSSSATALASTIVVIGLVVWARRYRAVGDTWGGTYLFASVFLGLCGVVAVYFFVELVVEALGRDITFTGRTSIWTASLEFLEREPWLGYGLGALWDPDNQPTRALWDEIGFDAANAHQGPLGLSLDLGLPALGVWFVLWLATFVASLRLLRSHVVAVWAFAFLLVQLMVGVVEPVFLNDWLTPLVLASILLGKIALDERRRRSDRDVLVDRIMSDIDLDAPVEVRRQPARS